MTEVRRVRFVAARLVKQDIPATGVLAMHIGLIGGIGPAATDFYYRRLISAFAGKNTALELTIVHADTPTLLAHLARNDAKAQIAIYQRLTDQLVAAGAGCVVVTSIAGHFCIDGFKDVSPLPVVDMIAEVRAAIEARGIKRIEIWELGQSWKRASMGASLPPRSSRQTAMISMTSTRLCCHGSFGVATPAQRAVFTAVGQRLLQDRGAEAIMLGGTDLALVFDEKTADFPLVDCAGIHVEAVMRLAMG